MRGSSSLTPLVLLIASCATSGCKKEPSADEIEANANAKAYGEEATRLSDQGARDLEHADVLALNVAREAHAGQSMLG